MTMLEISVTAEFERMILLLPPPIQKKLKKQERMIRSDIFHPSLRTEKLEPRGKELWSFRIDRSYRVVFRFVSGKHIRLLAIGPHSWIYRF